MLRKAVFPVLFALTFTFFIALRAYAHGTTLDADGAVQGVSPSGNWTIVHTRHDWTVWAEIHTVDITDQYHCIILGVTTQSGPMQFYDDLGPGTIQGGGDMWTY